jgi:predicted small lipoprotein YifL
MEALNAKTTGKAKRETLYGRDYLVAPMVLIVPGVLNGSKGPLYYPPEEVAKYPEIWNHKPITLNHPPNGANDPAILNQTQLGFLLNARYEGEKLIADGWFEVHRTAQVDKRILANLLEGKAIELSTGLSVDQEPIANETEHNGKKYQTIARNYRPDHLAILPDSIGACSIKDGCGVLVNAEGDPLVNAMSHEQIRDELHRTLAQQFKQDQPRCFILSVFDGFFIYEQAGKLYQNSYAVSGGKLSLGSNPVEVRREEQFKPVTSNLKGDDMAKKELVDSLIANCSCWTEADRETLNKLDDAKVQAMTDAAKKAKETEAVANAAKAGYEGEAGKFVWNADSKKMEFLKKMAAGKKGGGKAEEEDDEEEDDKKPAKNQQLSAEEWFKQAPPEVQSAVKNAMDIEIREKQSLIDRLTANLEDADKKAKVTNRLKDKSLDELRDLAELAPAVNNGNPFAPGYQPDYSGQAAAVANASDPLTNARPEPLGLPAWDYSQTN